MKVTLFIECCQYDPIEYMYNTKGVQDADAKWNLSAEYLQHLQEIEGVEHSPKEYFMARKQNESTDILRMFGSKGKESVSDEYLQKCWSQVKGNELLKIHFATWFEMTGPLVILTTERWKEKEITRRARTSWMMKLF